jgi:hypothetical protein
VDAVFIWILAPSAFGLPGVAIITLGQSTWNSDPFGPWAILMLLAVVGVNACTAFGGVTLARHAQHRDDHLT